MDIQYKVKKVEATTQYREIQPNDKKFIMNKLREIVEIADGCATLDSQEMKRISYRLKKPDKALPWKGKKYGGDMNSIYSAAKGIVDNIENGTQRDFSNRTCSIIEKSFVAIQKIIDWPTVNFIEVSDFTVVIPPQPPKNELSADLFDLSGIYEVTIKKK